MNISQAQYRQLNQILEKHGVALAYVFGSFAKEGVGPLSDFDIAIVFKKDVLQKEYFDRELRIAGEVGSILQINRVDVVNLETAQSPLLKHNAVFEGEPILTKDRRLQFDLERKVMQEHEDTEHLRRVNYKIMEEQIKDGSFGKAPFSTKQEQVFSKYVH